MVLWASSLEADEAEDVVVSIWQDINSLVPKLETDGQNDLVLVENKQSGQKGLIPRSELTGNLEWVECRTR